MKNKIPILLIFLFSPFLIKAQVTEKLPQNWTPVLYPSSGEKPSHYLLPAFEKALLKMNGGKINEALINYNTITEEIVFDQNGTKMAHSNPQDVDTIILNNIKFVRVGKAFYELAFDAPKALFIQYKRKLTPVGKPVGYGATSQTTSAVSVSSLVSSGKIYDMKISSDYEVLDNSVCWIRDKDIWHNFNNERQLLKIYPEKVNQLKSYIKTESLNVKVREDLIKLFTYLNTIK